MYIQNILFPSPIVIFYGTNHYFITYELLFYKMTITNYFQYTVILISLMKKVDRDLKRTLWDESCYHKLMIR